MTFVETWETPDTTDISVDQSWTEWTDDLEVVGGELRVVGVGNGDAELLQDVDVDHYAEIEVSTFTDAGPGSGRFGQAAALVRFTPNADRDLHTGYNGNLRKNFGEDTHEYHLERFNGDGTFTQLGTFALGAAPPTLPVTIRVEAEGSTIRLLENGVERISVTDATYSTETRVGVRVHRTNTEDAPTIGVDSFEAGDLAAQQVVTGNVFSPSLVFATGAAVPILSDVEAFTPTVTFPQGTVATPNDLVGVTFTPALSFPQGTVQAVSDLVGGVLTPGLSFPQGETVAVNTLTGVTFAPTLTFPSGNVEAGAQAQTLTGSLFTPTLTFPQGELVGEQFLTGNVYAPTLTFPIGNVDAGAQPQTVTGTVFTPTLSFPQGAAAAGTVTLDGVVFAPTVTFPEGTTTSEVTLEGAVFSPTVTFPQGTVSVVLSGATFTPGLAFGTGTFALGAVTLTGNVLTPALSFPSGVVFKGEKRRRLEGSGVLVGSTEGSKTRSGFLEGSRV